jgi:tetratricopeptide (TPR) repeat protein
MASPKKPTRKELLKTPDEFITTFGKIARFTHTHYVQIIWGIAVLTALVVAGAGAMVVTSRREVQAANLLDKALASHEAVLKAKDAAAARDATDNAFNALIRDYAKTGAGKLARIVYARICHQAGDTAGAAALYSEALASFRELPFYENLIYTGLGHLQMDQQDFKAAADLFEKALASAAFKDEALFALGLVYERLGEREKSRESFQRLIAENPQSIFFSIAKEKVAG